MKHPMQKIIKTKNQFKIYRVRVALKTRSHEAIQRNNLDQNHELPSLIDPILAPEKPGRSNGSKTTITWMRINHTQIHRPLLLKVALIRRERIN
ncbi:hypothetical protein [Undibacterium sp. RuRC25W]|uniref:hypothetical protein n=1 Tax=Undibacterium sp. RuRC25W TaxID=3413047 RepID=UPI003BF3BCBE